MTEVQSARVRGIAERERVFRTFCVCFDLAVAVCPSLLVASEGSRLERRVPSVGGSGHSEYHC